MELRDFIKMNKLIRGEIKLEEFRAWYESINAEAQEELLLHLHVFAQQAGYDEAIWEQAVQSSELSVPLIGQLRSFRGGYSEVLGLESNWFAQKDETERRLILTFLVYLFGYAEGRVYRNETEAYCNHWWHRDLLDDRVVQDLLGNPKFYYTSMKDDRAIKE